MEKKLIIFIDSGDTIIDESTEIRDEYGIVTYADIIKGADVMLKSFHHHMGTVVQSSSDIERLMKGTDPEYVSLLFDTGHLAYCDEDPLEVLKQHGDRVKHIHLKDTRMDIVKRVKEEHLSFLQGVRLGAFTVPGDGGGVDFLPIFEEVNRLGYEGYMLVEAEQDPMLANPLEYAIKARKYIRENTGL